MGKEWEDLGGNIMCKNVQRGYAAGDQTEFGGDAVPKLRRAAQNLYYLLNQGYPIKGASVFVGNHYLLSERQRLALVRAVSSQERRWPCPIPCC